MSNTRALPIRFPVDARDRSGVGPHQFAGLPGHLVGLVGENGLGGISYYFNDFQQWEGPVAEGSAGGWTLSGNAGATVATVVLNTVRDGQIVLTGDATAGANPTLQLGSASLGAGWRYIVGKRMWCFARLQIATVATTEVFFGLATPDTSPCVTGTFPADGIFFDKASTATKFDFHARQDGTSTERLLIGSTLVDATATVIGFQVDATGNIRPYQDGTYLSAGLIAAGNANIPDAAGDVLQFIVGILGASMTLTLDWLLIAQET